MDAERETFINFLASRTRRAVVCCDSKIRLAEGNRGIREMCLH